MPFVESSWWWREKQPFFMIARSRVIIPGRISVKAKRVHKLWGVRLILMVSVSVFVADEKISCATNKNEDMDIAFKSYLAKCVFEAQHVQPFAISFTKHKV